MHSYEVCPYSFYLKYIEKREDEQNFYAANGKLMHEIFEKTITNEIPAAKMTDYYVDNFDNSFDVRPSTMNNIFDKCLSYLSDLDENILQDYEIVGVELRLNFKVGKYNFTGFVDLLLKDKKTGNAVVLVDHKAIDHFLKKNGEPLKSKITEFNAYKHQMYLYCKGIKDNLGLSVNQIIWHHFKDGGELTKIPYSEDEYQETLNWAIDLIEKIRLDSEFEANKSFMMCHELCGFRHDCEY